VALLKYIDGARPELYDLRADPGETRNLFVERARDAESLSGALRESGVLEGMHEIAEGAIDPQTREMLLALGYARADKEPESGEEPVDAKDIAADARRLLGQTSD